MTTNTNTNTSDAHNVGYAVRDSEFLANEPPMSTRDRRDAAIDDVGQAGLAEWLAGYNAHVDDEDGS